PGHCSCGIAIVCVQASVQWTHLKSLFPAILNLASNAMISTNATCGENGPEMFCKLVEHVPGRPIRNPQCRICDLNSTNPRERHSIMYAIDGTNNWWQSPSIQNGRQYHLVTITLDLRQVFQVAYIIIKAANSPRPGNWILEHSSDGVEFKPWQYYATSDAECLTRYNIVPRIGPPTYKRDDEVICTSYYSRLMPLEHGEIHTSLINGRPSADDPSQTLLDFTSARYIRLQLQRIRTLNADLMTLSYRDPKEVDPIVTRRYYYSLKDISVGGMCICYGHARSCPWDETRMQLKCQCEHNTCGESCNECCPGYHQHPWKSGNFTSENVCEKCNCHGKAEDCYYDQNVADRNMSMNTLGQYIGGGVCINCTNNTAGINCETCIDGYYRPQEVSPHERAPCLPCSCDLSGSRNRICVKDDIQAASEHPSLAPGQCHCQEGYAGRRCDRCAFGFRGFPHCVRCNCSLIGSINEDPCSEPCQCKTNVEGEDCDQCKEGFYNLQERNPEGCTECFCFGVSSLCKSIPWPITQVTDIKNWRVTDIQGVKSVKPQQDLFDGLNQISINNTEARQGLPALYYWTAPDSYLRNKLTAYGGHLKFTVLYEFPMESLDSEMTSDIDVIIEGNGRTLSTGSDGLLLQPYEEQSVAVRLLPENFVDLVTDNPIDRDRLMTVLANVTRLQIRASYNVARKAIYRLSSVTLDVANPNAIDVLPAVDVEHCECPPGYTGISCESCGPGFYRVGGILFGGICQQCECNGHATHCDTDGACSDCQHNTTGPNCDRCLPGLYGDPTQGTPEDCKPCACPLLISSNNFSPTCHLNKGGEVICDQCRQGYAGPRCDRCADGYYGNPGIPGGWCSPCFCNGNVDPAEPGHCHPVTGDCLKCLGHTDGRLCERCAEGYYGDALVAKDCRACGCNVNGSYHMACDRQTGRCECKPNVVGVQCDRCLHGYFGLGTGLGCVPCNCSRLGSISEDCSEDGQCRCVLGVTAEKCDRCAHGYYGFQNGGCKPCDCVHTQNNCAAESGQCICPPHTQGAKCELCAANSWGHDPESGCKPCNCSEVGSDSLQCNGTSGQCPCRPEFGGGACRECAVGYRDYPECIACMCNINGTQPGSCDPARGECSCAQHTGLCPCKESVSGVRCDECKTGSFALSLSNPAGCSRCFCSGVSDSCSELQGLVRIPLSLTPDQLSLRVVSQGNLIGTIEGVYVQPPEVLLDAVLVQKHLKTEPYYWMLPALFTRDKLLAYGGTLRYAMAYYALEGSGSLNLEPQILLKGGQNSKIVIYRDMDTPSNGQQSQHEIDLTEHDWKYFNSVSDAPVTRADFMSVLSNIEYILIKASYGRGLQQSRISNITMEIAMEEDDTHAGRERAHQIEICDCPPGYAGLSCQVCAPGFYREMTELEANVPRSLNQPCMSCQCNNHSNVCDLDTGKCQGCRDHTAGDHCEQCAQGYYGRVNGSINDCSLCACPRHNSGSFSLTCVPEGLSDFRCDSCLPGYEGQYCQRCAPGYYGDPRVPGGRCQLCECNRSGSLHNNCDSLLGHCLCKSGVMGRLCDECEPRHVLVDSDCISCDDDCTGLLLSDLEKMETMFMSFNMTGFVPAPFGLLSSVEDNAIEYKVEFWVPLKVQTYPDCSVSAGLVEAANHLNETLGSDVALSDSSLRRLQSEIDNMMDILRQRTFDQSKATSANEAAEQLLVRVQTEFQKPRRELDELKAQIDEILAQRSTELHEAQDLVNQALATANETVGLPLLLLATHTRLFNAQDKSQNIEEDRALALTLVQDGREIVDSAANLAEDVILEQHKDRLYMWNTKLRMHVDKLVMEMNKKGVLDLVYRAEDHAGHLNNVASLLNSVLSDVRNVSVNTTVAAGSEEPSVGELLEEAEAVILEAQSNADAALTLVSRWLLEPQFAMQLFFLCPCGIDTTARVQQAKESVATANLTAAVTLDKIQGLSLRLLNASGTLAQVNETVRKTNELINQSAETAVAAGKRVKEIETQANYLLDRLKPLKLLEDNLSRNLSEIKELINQARKQAASIKVAVAADRDCVRAYQPALHSSNHNTLTLNVKTSEPDNLLFYLGSSTSTEFLAVEMRRGRVAFLWDVGSGTTRLEYPDLQINNNKWHRINAARFGRLGTLSVQDVSVSSLEKPGLKKTTSPGISTVLDVNDSTLVFVGGLSGQVKKAPAVKVTHFKGCMGETFLNGMPIGLWNYREKEGKCGGCFSRPQNEDHSFHYDGNGYSVVEKTLRTTATQIVMHFSTFSPNGLLLYLVSSGMRDFLAVELVDGKVRVSFDLGSGILALTSERRYNNGTWIKVAFQRNRKIGLLAVMDAFNSTDQEIKKAESPGGSLDLNRGTKDPIYIGGLPRSGKYRKEVLSRTFIGCLKNVEISRSTFDLLRNSLGVKKGCRLQPIRSVTILNDGYIQLRPKALPVVADLMATFATKNKTGIILAGFGKSGRSRSRRQTKLPFFAIMLVDGHLEVHINTGDSIHTRRLVAKDPSGTLSDGQEHSIIVSRNKRIVTLQVDEGNLSEVRLGSSTDNSPLNITKLYVGGVPAGEGVANLKVAKSFKGCIKNLAQCAVDELAKVDSNSYQFGLTQGSHMILSLDATTVKRKFTLQLKIRTFASSGLVYYMANQNQVDFAALQLWEGRLRFLFDLGKGAAIAMLPKPINDGKWHMVTTEYSKKRGTVSVDGEESSPSMAEGNLLDVEGKLYLGGLPQDLIPKKIKNVTHSVPACISSVSLNNKPLDTERPLSILTVGRCYTVVQEGTFFDGTGFAALVKGGYRVRSDMIVEFEFRTTLRNAVLFGISSAKVDAIGLEMVNSKILFHVNNGAGRITARYEPRDTNGLCDGKWHKLQASKGKHHIELTVDGITVQANNPHFQSTSADTNDPVYVGGYPANVKQNCLTLQTPFQGCVRNLKLTRNQQTEAFDLSRAFDLRGVFPHSCPGAEH
uniref:Laminin subunit alpha-2 n=1 Tax=Callorhinchus milii TaxID=7868 RepID=A0A4W3J5Q3_CALMI